MSNEYTHQILRIVVAQICQTIGWHSIQSTPLELLVDILHKYLQEITRETYRYTELYGRTQPNLDDVGLALRELNVNISDIEEYINYVDFVSCSADVPKYPVHKESNLNFLKPGSQEVLSRPVHVHEHLPPIYPDKEVNGDLEQNDIENTSDNIIHNSHENGVFKKPSDVINDSGGPINKKPRFAFDQEEGRPTREISSVMMTSSGFISPAREGKLPDAKSPVLPETKPIRKSPSPTPNTNQTNTAPPLPVGSMENKFDKKIKKKSASLASGGAEKERKRDKSLGAQASGTKIVNGTNHNVQHISEKQKLMIKKKKDKEKKHHKDHHHSNNVLSERSIGNVPVNISGNEMVKTSMKGDMNLTSAGIGNINSVKSDNQLSCHQQNMLSISSSQLALNTSATDVDMKPSKIDKLCSEPDKQKLNIFKKITSKKDRDDFNKSPNINYPDNQILSSIPEGTTITPAPPLVKSSSHHHQSKMSLDIERNDRDHVICLDDEQPPSMSITKIPPLQSSNYMKLSPHQAAKAISHDLEQFGTTAIPTPTPPKSQRKPRKNKQAAAAAAAVAAATAQLEQSMPLNLSNSNPLNMVKKDLLHHNNSSKLPATPSLPFSNIVTTSSSHKVPKMKKERKYKTKQKEQKKDLQNLRNNMVDFTKNNPLIETMLAPKMLPANVNHHRSAGVDNPFLPNKDSVNSKLGKGDSLQKQSGTNNNTGVGVGINLPPSGATGSPFGPPGPGFPGIPTIPMFPFYSFPPRPGLIPSTSLFSHLQPMAGDSSTFRQYLPAMMRFDFNNVHKGPKLGSKFDENERLPTPPPIPPPEVEKGYCNVAPLVPDSMKFQLSPPRYSSSSTGNNQKSPRATREDKTAHDNSDIRNISSHHQSESHRQHHQKSPKFIDTPIEISDDEKPKSDTDEKQSSKHHSDDVSRMNSSKSSTNSYHSDYVDNRNAKDNGGKDGGDRFSSPDRFAISAGGGGGNVSGVGGGYTAEHDDKHEKRKDKEHKKGKKGKDGKIKKKKDKKDKSKNKDKAGKRKDREEKKDKEKLKKLKKEKKKEKMRALIYSSDDGKQLNDSGDGSTSGAVPKLTLKLGINNSPQHSSDERKSSLKSDRRESSPELARISPLVTRPPKQKNLKEKCNDNEVTNSTTTGSASGNSGTSISSTATASTPASAATTNTLQPPSSSSSSTSSSTLPQPQIQPAPVPHRGPGRPPKNSNHHNSTNHNSSSSSALNSSSTHLDVAAANKIGVIHSTDAEGNQVWICPACGRVDDGTPMIGCDGCDAWYHWVCVGIQIPPDDNEDWYCRVCITKKQEAHGADKKKKRKKKNKAN